MGLEGCLSVNNRQAIRIWKTYGFHRWNELAVLTQINPESQLLRVLFSCDHSSCSNYLLISFCSTKFYAMQGCLDCSCLSNTKRHIFQDIVQQTINEYLPNELKRTRVNVFCFTEALLTSDSQGRRMLNTQQRTRSTGFLPGALKTRHRRKNSASSLTDSDSGKPGSALPPLSPYGGYASSEVGSDQGINDLRPRGTIATDRFTRGQSELRRTTQRSAVGQFHYFILCLYCSVVHFLCLLLQLSVTYSEVFSVPKFNFHAMY